jgi:hypothetical protein
VHVTNKFAALTDDKMLSTMTSVTEGNKTDSKQVTIIVLSILLAVNHAHDNNYFVLTLSNTNACMLLIDRNHGNSDYCVPILNNEIMAH